MLLRSVLRANGTKGLDEKVYSRRVKPTRRNAGGTQGVRAG